MRRNGTLERLFKYKAWANGELLAAMAQLDGATPNTEIAIRALNHTLIVDEIFAAHMRRTPPAHTAANADEAPTLPALAQAIRASDRRYVDYVSDLDDDQLAERIDFTFTDGEPGRMSREEMLMHLIAHGAQHRGQIGWIMALEGVTPPADGVTTYLHLAEAESRRREPGHAAAPTPAAAFAGRLPQTGGAAGAEDADPGASRLEALTRRLGAGLGGVKLGKTVKFDLKGDGFIFIGGGAVSNDDRPADLTLTIAMDDLRAIGQGRLSPMGAVSSGRLGLSNMGLAVSLQGPLKALFAATA